MSNTFNNLGKLITDSLVINGLINTGTSINNLGIDTNGNVVSTTTYTDGSTITGDGTPINPLVVVGGTSGGNQLISGGAVYSGIGLDFDVTALEYLIAGVTYNTLPTSVTLAVGDPSNSRFDAIVADEDGVVSVVQGTPATTPITPAIGDDQVLVQYVLIGVGATTPTITEEYIYREGTTPDWIPGVSCVLADCPTADFTSTTPTPFQGSECTLIDFTKYSTGRYIKYTTPSPVVRSDYAVLTFRIWLFDDLTTIDGGSGRRPFVRLYANGGTTWLGTVYLDGWGLQRNITNTWQLVSIPLGAFAGNPSVNQIDQFRIHCVEYIADPVPTTQIAIDDVKLQSGYGPQVNQATIDLLENGSSIGDTARLNFIDGKNTTVVLTDDNVNNKIDVQVDLSFTGNTSGDCITDLYVTNVYGCSPITVHDNIQSLTSSATGTTSFAFGFQTKAHGNYSTASGYQTTASGAYSHAGGIGSSATNFGSVAWGNLTLSSGLYSHAEGNSTTANGNFSHAEGANTITIGIYSHAEGSNTTAGDTGSHAEGVNTKATGIYSHAEGNGSQATGSTSHAEGFQTKAHGDYSHAEGYITTASQFASHAEGRQTVANALYSHAEGYQTTASQFASHAEGQSTVSTGVRSHAEGYLTQALGSSSHAEGKQTTASGYGSHAQGYLTTTNGDYSHVGGQQNSIEDHDNNNIYGGKFQTISASTSANGCNTVSGGYNNQIVGGFASVAMGIGGYIDGSINYHFGQGSITEPTINSGAKQVVFGDGVATTGPAGKTNTILFDTFAGNGYWDGAADVGPADYAEYFEWNDGNTLDEDRVGYFVSLVSNTEKIEMSNNNVIGIVSAKPAIVGDSAFFGWQNRYVMDEWGRDLSDEYDMYQIKMTGDTGDVTIYISENDTVYSEYPNLGNPNGVLYNESTDDKIFIQKTTVKRINPSYDPTQQYISRQNRPEWSAIGLLGKLRVKTAEQITGPSVSVNSNGMAINGSDYPVLETIKAFDGSYGIVKVLFK